MISRVAASLGLIVLTVIGLALAVAVLGVVWWLSVLAYDAGIWPLGALLRIFVWVTGLSVFVGGLIRIIMIGAAMGGLVRLDE